MTSPDKRKTRNDFSKYGHITHRIKFLNSGLSQKTQKRLTGYERLPAPILETTYQVPKNQNQAVDDEVAYRNMQMHQEKILIKRGMTGCFKKTSRKDEI